MGSTYTPTYYTSLHESITSICKNILPFSFKKRRVPAIAAAEHRLSKQQSDNLKWQQESFHQMLKLMGLCEEGILDNTEVSAFRTHLIDAITTPASMDYEAPIISRDKLIFLQELLYAKCITEDEYHASKKPLLRSLAAQGAMIRESDVIVAAHNDISSDEWPVIDSKEKKQCSVSNNEQREGSSINGHSSVSEFVAQDENGKSKEDKHSGISRKRNPNVSTTRFSGNELVCSTENPFWNRCVGENENENESESKSILMMEILPEEPVKGEKGKKKPPFRSFFQRNQKEEGYICPNNGHDPASEDKETPTLVKRAWGLNGFTKWKKNDTEDETAPLSLGEKSDTKNTKKNLHQYASSQPNFFVDDEAITGEKVKNEPSQIKAERSARSPRVNLSDIQMEDISTRHPDENADLKELFPESWCDQHVLGVVRKDVEGHKVGEMGSSQVTTKEKNDSRGWSTFDDEENTHPNLFAPQCHLYSYMMQDKFTTSSMNARTSFNKSSIDKGFRFNPFLEM